MPEFEKDLLLRQIRQLGQMVAVLLKRAREEANYESGLEAVREAAATGLGPDRALIDRLDPASAMLLLRDRERAQVYADVCAAEAELLEALGRGAEAAPLHARAEQIRSAARAPFGD